MGRFSDFFSADKRRENINSFVSNASSNGTTEIHIEQICSALQLDYLKTVKDLEAMIELTGQYRLLNKAYIDLSTKTLILSSKKENSITDKLKNMVDDASDTILGQKFFGQKNTGTKNIIPPVKCQSCGATNSVLDGRVNECEYCGSPI